MDQENSFNLVDHVFDYLYEGITAEKWMVGEKLPSEAQLCQQLGASRTTVRSAIDRLIGLGLAQSIRGKGTFVRTPSLPENVSSYLRLEHVDRLSVFEFRKVIEGESASLAAIRANAADVQEMERLVLEMEANRSQADVAAQDMAFHYLIARATKNEIILRIFDVMRSTYARMFEDNVSKLGNIGVEQHRRILASIQIRDMAAARQCMLDHLDETMRAVCRH